MTAAEFCQSSGSVWVVVGFYVLDKSFEYWLGKTDKVKAGSMVELAINAVKRDHKEK